MGQSWAYTYLLCGISNYTVTNQSFLPPHYGDVIMGTMASEITSLRIVYSTVYSGAEKKTSKLRVTGLCERNSLVTGAQRPVTRIVFPLDDVIMITTATVLWHTYCMTLDMMELTSNMLDRFSSNNSWPSLKCSWKFNTLTHCPLVISHVMELGQHWFR